MRPRRGRDEMKAFHSDQTYFIMLGALMMGVIVVGIIWVMERSEHD